MIRPGYFPGDIVVVSGALIRRARTDVTDFVDVGLVGPRRILRDEGAQRLFTPSLALSSPAKEPGQRR
jgi:hypothetical protein